jgi:hypothetical protein
MEKRSEKNKVILAPPLPPDADDEDIFISNEEVDFVEKYPQHIHLIAGPDRKLLDKVVRASLADTPTRKPQTRRCRPRKTRFAGQKKRGRSRFRMRKLHNNIFGICSAWVNTKPAT